MVVYVPLATIFMTLLMDKFISIVKGDQKLDEIHAN